MTIEEMRTYCVAWCEKTLIEPNQYLELREGLYVRRYEKTTEHPRYWAFVFGIVLWPIERKHDDHNVGVVYSVIRAFERGDLNIDDI